MMNEMLHDIWRARRAAVVGLGLFVLLTLGLYLYVNLWQDRHLAQAQHSWTQLSQAAAGAQQGTPASRYRAGVRDLEQFRSRLIRKGEFPRFLGELFETARHNSLAVRNVTYRPSPVKGEEVLTYGIEFTVAGRYGQLKSFIADLARSPQIVTIDSITLTNASRTEEMVELKLGVTAFLKLEGA